MAISVANFGPLTEPILRRAFVDGWRSIEDPILDLYKREKTTKEVEHEIGIDEMETTPEFTGILLETEYFKQHQKDYILKEWGHKLEIQRRAWSTDQYKAHAAKANMLGDNLKRRYLEQAAVPFNQAISGLSAIGQCADGLALGSGAHTSLTPGGPTQSARVTAALSYSSIITAKNRMRSYLTPRGQRMSLYPDLLLTSTSEESLANQEVNSPDRPDTASRAISVVKGGFYKGIKGHKNPGIEVMSSNFLDDTQMSFMISTSYMAKMGLRWFDHTPPEFVRDQAFDTKRLRFSIYSAQMNGEFDWRWAVVIKP